MSAIMDWIKRRWLVWAEWIGAWLIFGVLAFMALGCSEDRTGHTDLPEEKQAVDVSGAMIVANPDGFPNIAHKCVDDVGFWTTTDRTVIIIYNDWSCPGATREKDMIVINAVPRSIVNTGS